MSIFISNLIGLMFNFCGSFLVTRPGFAILIASKNAEAKHLISSQNLSPHLKIGKNIDIYIEILQVTHSCPACKTLLGRYKGSL